MLLVEIDLMKYFGNFAMDFINGVLKDGKKLGDLTKAVTLTLGVK